MSCQPTIPASVSATLPAATSTRPRDSATYSAPAHRPAPTPSCPTRSTMARSVPSRMAPPSTWALGSRCSIGRRAVASVRSGALCPMWSVIAPQRCPPGTSTARSPRATAGRSPSPRRMGWSRAMCRPMPRRSSSAAALNGSGRACKNGGGAFVGRLHVGRVNGLRQLRLCADIGAASCDGTGFGRAVRQWNELETFLAEMNGERQRDAQTCASFDPSDAETDPGLRSCATAAPDATGEGR